MSDHVLEISDGEDGSVLVGFGVAVVTVVLMVGVGVVATAVAVKASAATAADAAALASAPVTFRPFGAAGTPKDEAARFARANGASLVTCSCPVDVSWNPRTVSVTVVRRINLPVIGALAIRATSRADFDPIQLLGLGEEPP